MAAHISMILNIERLLLSVLVFNFFYLKLQMSEPRGKYSKTVYGRDFLKIVCHKQVVTLLTEQHGVKMTSTAGVVRVQPLVPAGA